MKTTSSNLQSGPIHEASVSDWVLRPDESAKAKMVPMRILPIIGKASHAGRFDSRDFWISGLEMIDSSVFMVNMSCESR